MEDRQFFPPYYPYYPYYPYPYYRPRRFFPFFFIFPFGRRRRRPFFRDEERDQSLFFEHKCADGDTIQHICRQYNVPEPILMELNPHLQHRPTLKKGDTVQIPRMDEIYCQKMFMEEDDYHMGPGMMPHGMHYPDYDHMMPGMGGMPGSQGQ